METQNSKILAELLANKGDWIPMPHLVEVSGSYNVHSRISDLRAHGHDIENKRQLKGRTLLSYYRIPEPAQAQLF